MVLRFRMPDTGCLEIPDGGFTIRVDNAFCGLISKQVGVGNLEHRICITLRSRLLPPMQSHLLVFRGALTVIVEDAQTQLRIGIVVVCQGRQHLDRLRETSLIDSLEGIIQRLGARRLQHRQTKRRRNQRAARREFQFQFKNLNIIAAEYPS